MLDWILDQYALNDKQQHKNRLTFYFVNEELSIMLHNTIYCLIEVATLLLVNEWFYNAKWASDLFLGIRGRCDFNQIGHLIEALSIILKNISYTTLKCSDISKALHQLLLLGQKNINFITSPPYSQK
jgi:hypothetical protein